MSLGPPGNTSCSPLSILLLVWSFVSKSESAPKPRGSHCGMSCDSASGPLAAIIVAEATPANPRDSPGPFSSSLPSACTLTCGSGTTIGSCTSLALSSVATCPDSASDDFCGDSASRGEALSGAAARSTPCCWSVGSSEESITKREGRRDGGKLPLPVTALVAVVATVAAAGVVVAAVAAGAGFIAAATALAMAPATATAAPEAAATGATVAVIAELSSNDELEVIPVATSLSGSGGAIGGGTVGASTSPSPNTLCSYSAGVPAPAPAASFAAAASCLLFALASARLAALATAFSLARATARSRACKAL